jgi:predicted alpha/beta-hydrolase family hydrolase
MATYLVAEGYPAAGVILYAYPLHPAGKEDKLRVAHFPEVRVPLLFFQGTRDALSRMVLFERHIGSLPNASVQLLEGVSHSFRGGGWAAADLLQYLVTATTEWMAMVSSGRSHVSGP